MCMECESKSPMYSNLLHGNIISYVHLMLYGPIENGGGIKRSKRMWPENTTIINQRPTHCAKRENIDSQATAVTYFKVKQPALPQLDNCKTRNDAKNICNTLQNKNQTKTSNKSETHRLCTNSSQCLQGA